jgi:hypothetical protein
MNLVSLRNNIHSNIHSNTYNKQRKYSESNVSEIKQEPMLNRWANEDEVIKEESARRRRIYEQPTLNRPKERTPREEAWADLSELSTFIKDEKFLEKNLDACLNTVRIRENWLGYNLTKAQIDGYFNTSTKNDVRFYRSSFGKIAYIKNEKEVLSGKTPDEWNGAVTVFMNDFKHENLTPKGKEDAYKKFLNEFFGENKIPKPSEMSDISDLRFFVFGPNVHRAQESLYNNSQSFVNTSSVFPSQGHERLSGQVHFKSH